MEILFIGKVKLKPFQFVFFRPTLSSVSWLRMGCAHSLSCNMERCCGVQARGFATMLLLDTLMGTLTTGSALYLQKTFLDRGADIGPSKWEGSWGSLVSCCMIWQDPWDWARILAPGARRGPCRSLTRLNGHGGWLHVPAPEPRQLRTCHSCRRPLTRVQGWRH